MAQSFDIVSSISMFTSLFGLLLLNLFIFYIYPFASVDWREKKKKKKNNPTDFVLSA